MKVWKCSKVRDHYHYIGIYRGATHSICNTKCSVPIKSSVAFHNGSNYDYHFIIKELSEEFDKKNTCLREITEKYIIFLVPIEKEVTRIDENLGEIKI